MTRLEALSLPAAFALSICLFPCSAWGQQTSAPALPDAPEVLLASSSTSASGSGASYSSSATIAGTIAGTEAATDAQTLAAAPPPEHQDPQTKRILGIIPNFRAVSANVTLPPQSVKEKFITASQDSFDYSSIVLPAVLAGFNQARNNTPEFRQGGVGYGRYLWHSVVDQTSENYFVEFIVPAIAHEDTRFYTLGHGGFKKRAVYSLSRIVITRDDAGKEVFNTGEILGAGMAAALSNAYYPAPERTFGNTAQQWGTSIGIDAFTFVFKEFWPDINHKLFHGAKN
jgi:hypothetical protein